MDQIKLLEEAEVYKKWAADMNDMSCIIQSRSKFYILLFVHIIFNINDDECSNSFSSFHS